ncbi:MAG: hypothetical protein Q4A05_05130 [Ruminococcus sp.]|nr:hypothetical protein [Ruminococcus sp.]
MDNKYKPIVFSITDEKDLKKIYGFKAEHTKSCREKYPDVFGALFTYSFVPTGLGPLCFVKCACGEEITLDSDFNF